MEREKEDMIVKTSFGAMYRILKYIDQQMDNETFDTEHFTAEELEMSEPRFAKILKSLIDGGFVEGVEVRDHGAKDEFSPKNYKRYSIIIDDDVTLTFSGMQFMAEQTAFAKTYKAAKGFRDLLPM